MFVSIFPHVIAGPIVRWRQLADKEGYRPDWDNIAKGLTIFCLGIGKKVLIADKLALFVTPVFDAASAGEPISAVAAWGRLHCLFAAALFRLLRLFGHGRRPRLLWI